MRRLVIFVEGDLERAVLKPFLDPYTQARFGQVDIIRGSGNGYFRGNFVEDVRLELTEADTYVVCLIDLYEEPFGVFDPSRDTVEAGFEAVRRAIEAQVVGHPNLWRFAAFPVVREPEAWLFACRAVMNKLQSQPHPAPETIPHPAGDIKRLYSGYVGKLSTGRFLFGLAHAREVYEDNCPHFRLLIDWITNPPQSPAQTREREAAQAWIARRDALDKEWQALEQAAYAVGLDDEALLAQADDKYAEYRQHCQTYSH
jgi:hypothetical protein